MMCFPFQVDLRETLSCKTGALYLKDLYPGQIYQLSMDASNTVGYYGNQTTTTFSNNVIRPIGK